MELEADCISISFTLDMWTAPNRTPIFAVIGHWISKNFEEREEVLEFIEVTGPHTGEALAEIVLKLTKELNLGHKLFAITGDNAGNNGTLCAALFKCLKKTYDDKDSPIGKPRMQFHGRFSWIRCFAHVVALVCKDILTYFKAGTAKEAKKLLDSWDREFKHNGYEIPLDPSRSSIAKIRLLNLWILRSSEREQDWRLMPKTVKRRPIYDVDTRWNSAYDMVQQFLDLLPEYTAFVESHDQVRCLLPSECEIVALRQLAFVLAPFKDLTLKVSKEMPSLVRSLELYWDLDDLLKQVVTGAGDYSQLDQSLRDAFKAGQKKYMVYDKKLESNSMIYAAHILDPRCKASMIKDMMPVQFDQIIDDVKHYFKTEWPAVAGQDAPNLEHGPLELGTERPFGMSIAQWRGVQAKREREAELFVIRAICELDRWIGMDPEEWIEASRFDPHFVRNWWKVNSSLWPHLAVAARALLPCAAAEVDVERLFSGCRDEYGIRRHALHSNTVRMLTLLRSNYQSEDKLDQEQIQDAMKLDLTFGSCFSTLFRPDRIDGHVPGICSLFIPSL
jgi:hypothetical protein